MHVFLDVSRLLKAGRRAVPSGIDRVEMAYVRHWIRQPAESRTFVAELPWGGFAALPPALVRDLAGTMAEAWRTGTGDDRIAWLAHRARLQLALGGGRRRMASALEAPGGKALLVVSHHALERPNPIRRLRRKGVAFVPLIHDLIPTTHPEYARPGMPERHRRRVMTTAMLADAVITNSAATADDLVSHLGQRGDLPPVTVAPLGVEPPDVPPPPVPLRPYFVVLGTIEPRKNHLLLLNLWRDFAATLGPTAPRLVVVGRRGWENENVLDMLERCSKLDGLVREAGQLPDLEVAELLRGARALLFPSFAEGYGLPLAEALALGAPCICSDLPALREVGREAPEYLSPLDGAAWRSVILDYARPDSASRRGQLVRLANWQRPTWDEHFRMVGDLLARLAEPGERRPEPDAQQLPRAPRRVRAARLLAGGDEAVS